VRGLPVEQWNGQAAKSSVLAPISAFEAWQQAGECSTLEEVPVVNCVAVVPVERSMDNSVDPTGALSYV